MYKEKPRHNTCRGKSYRKTACYKYKKIGSPNVRVEDDSQTLTYGKSYFLVAQREGFEPSCGVIHKLISSQPRYDRFDTSA